MKFTAGLNCRELFLQSQYDWVIAIWESRKTKNIQPERSNKSVLDMTFEPLPATALSAKADPVCLIILPAIAKRCWLQYFLWHGYFQYFSLQDIEAIQITGYSYQLRGKSADKKIGKMADSNPPHPKPTRPWKKPKYLGLFSKTQLQ